MSTIIGASLPRPDALGKVTGAAQYPADLIRPGMLHLHLVLAGRPHARIVTLNTSAARAHSGVVAVLTAADVPFNAHGLIDADQPALCGEVVRFEGDKVALVAAESKAAAEAGARLVRVEYEDLPAVTDPRAALAPDAPLVHAARGSNLLLHVPIRRGDVARAFAEADVVLEGNFATSWQEHAFLQPEAGIAYLDDAGRVVVETAGQWLHEDRRQIAAMLRLPEDQVIVRYAAIGGAFGGREDLSLQHLLALAAWKLRRPVAMQWSREESMIAHHKRHPFSIRCKWGATRDGRITAVEAELIGDGAAYASTSVEVTKVATLFASGCYEVPNIAVDGYAVYTNNVPCGAFRGFAADAGEGAHLAPRQIAAEPLGSALEQVTMITNDSAEAPSAGSASASRMTLMGGRAVRDAAVAASDKWSAHEDYAAVAEVQFRPPATTPLDPVSGAGRPNYCYGYAAQAGGGEVNTLTGQGRGLSVISVHDRGRAINMQQVEGQIEGCLAQALGYALLENFQVRAGHVLTPYFSTYLLPTGLDMPPVIVPVVLERADPTGPFGARGVAEMALVPLAPAIAAAIHDATGVWLTQQPMTPERVLAALRDVPARHALRTRDTRGGGNAE